MIGKLFYLCPSCNKEDVLIQNNNFLVCHNCQSKFLYENNKVLFNGKYYFINEFYTLIRQRLSDTFKDSDKELRISKESILRQGVRNITFKGYDDVISMIESPVEVDNGKLVFQKKALIFRGKEKEWYFPKSQITGFTTNSNYFEFKIKNQPFYQIFFENESPLKYEDLLSLWFEIDPDYKKLIEHQPKIIQNIPSRTQLLLKHDDIENWNLRERIHFFELLLHIFIGLPITLFLRWRANLIFKNDVLIPKQGPFILIINHESYLDPILISTLSPRRVGFFTKSTTFADRILQPIFRAYRSLPNRRYEIDPHVVRQALGRIKKGNCIGIFPEGERTWDGQLLPFKFNTIRFLMSVQVPIVLVKISGAYDVLPRWTHKIQKGEIKIEVLRCFSLIPGAWDLEELKDELEDYYRI